MNNILLKKCNKCCKYLSLENFRFRKYNNTYQSIFIECDKNTKIIYISQMFGEEIRENYDRHPPFVASSKEYIQKFWKKSTIVISCDIIIK